MKIHHREQRCAEARADLSETIERLQSKHDLTAFEVLRVLNEAASNWIASLAKYGIRSERHGDTETPGGVETEAKKPFDDGPCCGECWNSHGACIEHGDCACHRDYRSKERTR